MALDSISGVPSDVNKPIALVLQGGGALGAHEWGAVTRLCEAGYHPVAVTGVSIGAVNAAAIAGARNNDIIGSLKRLWNRLTLHTSPFLPDPMAEVMSMFGHPAMYRLRSDFDQFLGWTAYCEMEPLHRTLREICDFDQINDWRHMGFAVTATDIENGDSKRFLNTDPDVRLTPEHIIASGALPPGFPMALVDGKSYWDGGVFDNTPMAPMLDLLERLEELGYQDVPVVVIELFPGDEAQDLPTNMYQLKNRMMELTYQNRFWDDYGGLDELRQYAAMIDRLRLQLADDAVARDKQFKQLIKRRHFKNLHVIPSSHVPMTGAMDFTKKSIDKRFHRGYAAAAAMIGNWEKTGELVTG